MRLAVASDSEGVFRLTERPALRLSRPSNPFHCRNSALDRYFLGDSSRFHRELCERSLALLHTCRSFPRQKWLGGQRTPRLLVGWSSCNISQQIFGKERMEKAVHSPSWRRPRLDAWEGGCFCHRSTSEEKLTLFGVRALSTRYSVVRHKYWISH